MKRTFFVAVLLTAVVAAVYAKSDVADVRCRVTTYDGKGAVLGSCYGMFVAQDGVAVSPYAPFKGAAKAEVVDADGKKWNVERICGASDLYEVVKFKTNCSKAPMATLGVSGLSVGATLQIADTLGNMVSTTVEDVQTYDGLLYYTLNLPADDRLEGSPVYDGAGNVVAMLQKSSVQERGSSFALDISFVERLHIDAMSAGVTALNDIHIAKQLPADKEQAASYVYLLSKNIDDDEIYLTSLNDYISLFPYQADGYCELGLYYAARGNYPQAEQAYEKGLSKAENKADVHYNKSKLIYQLNRSDAYETYSDWTFEKALEEVGVALEEDGENSLYKLQEGDCRFALKQYQEAYDIYQALNASSSASAETFHSAAIARYYLDGDSAAVLALLDSAVACFAEPYRSQAGPYLLQRAYYRALYGEYRLSALDYKSYEDLIGSDRLNDQFFYAKEQVDFRARLFQWALEDIEKALEVAPDDYIYLVEKSLVQIRCAQFDEAILTAKRALQIEPDGADAHKMMGIAYGESGQKEEALEHLRRARELGDPQAEALIAELQQ